MLLEKQGSSTTATYTYGNALVRKDGEVPLFDGQGSERTVTNSSQTVTGTLTTSAFGTTVATTGSSTNPYMYGATSGYRNEGDAGLMKVGCRYYDAQTGTFTSRDTSLDQKPYLYCEHDPVNATDPSGHFVHYIPPTPPDWVDRMNDMSNTCIKFGVGLQVIGLIGAVFDGPVGCGTVIVGGGLIGIGGLGKVVVGVARLVQRFF